MSNQLMGTAELINDKVKFSAVSRDNDEIIIDYVKPFGGGEGYTSLELFLLSLATCSGTSITFMLRKMHKDVTGLKITIYGERRAEHPTYFKSILMRIELKSRDVETPDIEKAIKISEDSICPVWNMVKNNVEISCEYEIIRV
ncbi:MAG: OsmC family protein [Eubacteriales bacterium]|nr:OsmC family protein [Eubacteriales bacterium]